MLRLLELRVSAAVLSPPQRQFLSDSEEARFLRSSCSLERGKEKQPHACGITWCTYT